MLTTTILKSCTLNVSAGCMTKLKKISYAGLFYCIKKKLMLYFFQGEHTCLSHSSADGEHALMKKFLIILI